ncbi:F-box/LRR-repeat protein 25-like [Salvia miltiorrhiza]|uniref:F-box/LRR-repeat protein 25-like n=1 Tax=Salvia miltiorrhiza TaxID=226208 RepID=UPI0025AD894F|nr:F-box/LRR-repeat protein 25-like [Salvia miltiorrhiza]
MTNSKRCKYHDRLSQLPDALIFEIFWLMPMTDVVRTSLLSKRWRNLWTITPFLNFDIVVFDEDRRRKFVNKALLCWNGTRVLKFKISDSRYWLGDSMVSDVDFWVWFAKKYGVEELSLLLLVLPNIANSVPQCLYSCSSLKELWLYCCNLEISGNVQWNQLESLTLRVEKVNTHMINQILSGSPQLRVFDLGYMNRDGNLSIQSNSLKKLLITNYNPMRRTEVVVSKLRICTPNLEELVLGDYSYSKCLPMNVSSLTCVDLALFGLEALGQILPTIQHVENVILSTNYSPKGLGAMKMNSSFPNVKSLQLTCCSYDYKHVVGVLEIFPKLERLVLQYQKEDGHQDHIESLNLPESFVLQLRTVEVTWAEGDDVFPLIEIILKYASKLEKIVFRLIETKSPSPPSNSLFSLSQKLLGMRRSSTNCTIDLTMLPS